MSQLHRTQTKLEATLDDLENSLEREKHSRADVEKSRRKLEGEMKLAQDTIDELKLQRTDLEAALKRSAS